MIVYILYEERESSELCGVKGVWRNRHDAITRMQELIEKNVLYSKFSNVNITKGFAESDPTYTEKEYSNYNIKEIQID